VSALAYYPCVQTGFANHRKQGGKRKPRPQGQVAGAFGVSWGRYCLSASGHRRPQSGWVCAGGMAAWQRSNFSTGYVQWGSIQTTVSLWTGGNLDRAGVSPNKSGAGGLVIAMGRKVQRELERKGFPHLRIVHPAARGTIRKKERYAAHLRAVLGKGR
jgi:hypothetical protein